MPLTEVLTIEVGAAIAKSILKIWVKNTQLGEDISSSLIDLLKAKTEDLIAQHRGQRQFEIIGEKVGESLLPLFEVEGAHLSENDRIAVAKEVATAFTYSKLSSELLAKRNLEPKELAKYVLASHPIAARLFSSDEETFYRRIIEESCVYIVDIASQLPAFTERTFSEILKREDQLLARTDEILKEILRVREQLFSVEEQKRFEINYRLSVARTLDELRLLGADVSLASRRHRLSVAYITLLVEEKAGYGGHGKGTKEIGPSKLKKNFIDTSIDLGSNVVSVETALARSSRLLICGPAGSGKTTLLQWIAVKSATRSFEGILAKWNDRIPFYIRLRQWVQTGLPRPEAFPSLIAPVIAETMPKRWVHDALEKGRALVLIDGLDEVSTSRREEVRLWLRELVENYSHSHFIITSRPHAVEEGWMNRQEFRRAELQPMMLTDIYLFIDNWHKAAREELYSDEEIAELDPLAEHLKHEVGRNRPIQNLATNPLLCAMLCALHRDRGRQLPNDRIELYEACCSLLLERRDLARQVDLSDYPALQLTYRQRRRFLEDLAYWMIKNGWSEVSIQLVEERFSKKLEEMRGVPSNVSGFAICHFYVERSGIIREPGAGSIDFVHRTFQEFLAAKAAADEVDFGILVANAQDDRWREVIILACGLATIPMRVKIIEGILARGVNETERRHQLHLLAVSCLETAIDVGQKVKEEVEMWMSALIPPKDMTEAAALVPAGELAVKYLARNMSYSETSTAACIRSLALIGSESALDTLEEYASDMRPKVFDELVRAWDSFNRTSYAQRVLARVPIRDFSVKRLVSIKGFQYLTQLTTLNLSDCEHVSDLTPLASLTQLTTLKLQYCKQVSDLSPLAGLKQLTTLILSDCEQVSDLSPLASLTQLITLVLEYCRQVSDLSPLGSLTQLTTLNIEGCFSVTDLQVLRGLPRLKRIVGYGALKAW